MTDRNYEILEHIAVLSENASGWRKELTLTKWFDNEPKYDIRDWAPDHEHMSRGATLTEQELARLMNHVLEKTPEIKSIMDNEKHKALKEPER